MVLFIVVLLLPDRLPSFIVLVGFWIPPAVAGLVAAYNPNPLQKFLSFSPTFRSGLGVQ
jgi:hypothetical protein